MLINSIFKSVSSLSYRLVVVLVIVTSPKISMAIVNMDGLHFNNIKDTFSSNLDLKVSGSSGNSNNAKAALNAQFNWVTKKSINLAIMGYQYGESNNVRSVNKAFIHYRYIYQLAHSIDWELFAQMESNEFTRLSYRGLLGTGVRFSAWNTDNHHAFFGIGAFHSREETEITPGLTDDGIEQPTRANFYLLSKYKVTPSVNFSNAIYYQPRLSQPSDYRALLESKFDFKINDDLSFRISLDIAHDSLPSQTIEATDISYMSGLVFSF